MVRLLRPTACAVLTLRLPVAALMVLSLALSQAGAAEPDRPLEFERDVWPVVSAHCISCHGEDAPKGGLDLRSVAAMLRGGESGPAVTRLEPAASLILARVEKGEMPPEGERRLSSDEATALRAWVLSGAPAQDPDAVPPPVSPVRDEDRRFWSFQPLARPTVPTPRDAAGSRSPVDAFLLARLNAVGLAYSPDADPTTLVRRAYLDLWGLPPTPEQVDAFLADERPDAFEHVIDSLLASPHFGERWGRHWLDVAGYVDTVGFDTDATNVILSEGKWRYRDYVIRAFNEDKPYDRFLTEQLAGDELSDWRQADHLTPAMLDALVATGYLRTARDLTHEDVGVIPQNFFGIMHDTLETMGTGLLGLTLNCARCHNHKFDPLPQQDYYRLLALLTPAYNPQAWLPVIPYEPKVKDRVLADVGRAEQAEIERHNAEVDRRLAPVRAQLAALRKPHEARLLDAKLATLPEPIRADTRAALDAAADQRSAVQQYLVDKFGASLKVRPEEVTAALDEATKTAAAPLDEKIATLEKERRKWGKIQALFDVGPPPATHLLLRGNETTPGAEVGPGFLRVLSRTDADALAKPVPPYAGTSGRRLALARWLTQRDSPAAALVARVMVNRAWQQLFGRGIVPTSDNFGAQGQRPTHPELLEWLASEFIDNGWRIKPLVKSMMLTAAYRQASHREQDVGSSSVARGVGSSPVAIDPTVVDPANDLLWRMRLRRLEGEAIRDSILAVSGKLEPGMGGPAVMINARPDGMVVVEQDKLPRPADALRRSIYMVTRRAYNLSLLTVFDQPLVATNCARRDASAVPLQSLMMLNDAFVAEQAKQFAARVAGTCSPGADECIERAFRLALARRPNEIERATCRDLLAQQVGLHVGAGEKADAAAHKALVQLCHTLLNSSEFLYIE